MLNRQQQQFFNDIISLNKNYFLTGFAGTGKSFLVNQIIEECKKQNIEIAVASTTGSSAVDIGGSTYHSLFGVYGMYTEGMEVRGLKKNFKEVELIIIDEISMMGPDMLDLIDKKLRANTGYNTPFGGIKILLVGDKKQLGPIYAGDDEVKNKILTRYDELEFYKADVFKEFEEICLTEIIRSNDEKFLALVNRVREGDNTPFTEFKRERIDNADNVHIAFRNDWVDAYNQEKLGEYEYDYVGSYLGEFKNTDCTSPQILNLRVGARVMITKNMKEEGLMNGDMGTITKLTQETIHFQSDRLNQEFEIKKQSFYKTEYSNNESFDKHEILNDFEKKFLFTDNYEYDKEEGFIEILSNAKLYPIITGKFIQFPLRLAWAMTIHKSQGKTFPKMTLVMSRFDNKNMRQCYVGISRGQTYENTYVKYI